MGLASATRSMFGRPKKRLMDDPPVLYDEIDFTDSYDNSVIQRLADDLVELNRARLKPRHETGSTGTSESFEDGTSEARALREQSKLLQEYDKIMNEAFARARARIETYLDLKFRESGDPAIYIEDVLEALGYEDHVDIWMKGTDTIGYDITAVALVKLGLVPRPGGYGDNRIFLTALANVWDD